MTEQVPQAPRRRRTVAKSLVVLGAAAIGLNAILLARDGGSSAPQWVNIVLGSVLLVAGLRILGERRA